MENKYYTSTPTNNLRILLRDNKQILQQQWRSEYTNEFFEYSDELVWKDVPMVLEVLTSNKKL